MYSKQCWLDQEKEILGGIAYCNEALSQPDIENWEKKEYESVLEHRKVELKETQDHIAYLKADGHWDAMSDGVNPNSIVIFGEPIIQ